MSLFYSADNELRSGWKILRVFVIVIILMAVFAILAALLNFQALADYAVHLAMIIGALWGVRLEHKSLTFIGIRLRERAFWQDAILGFAWGCLFIGLVVGGMVFITKEMSLSQIGDAATIPGLAYALVFWLVVAIGEESLFRGYILSVLRQRMSSWLGLIISAGLFGAIHVINPDYYWFAYVYAFLIGIVFGGIVIRRGSLGGVIGLHYAWNLLQDKGLLNTPARGGEVIYTIILLAIIALIYWVVPGRATDDEQSSLKAPNTA